MLPAVKKCIDDNDIKGLKYIFMDCLDVDPTFEKYKEDYDYCKKLNGFFDDYIPKSPLLSDRSRWDKSYWEKLKIDLNSNFSSERFEHMIEVAKVVYADKFARLQAERQKAVQSPASEKTSAPSNDMIKAGRTNEMDAVRNSVQNGGTVSSQEQMQVERLQEQKRQIELENQRIEEAQRRQKERIEAGRRKEQKERGTEEPKKAMGIVVAVVAVIIVAVIAISLL